jgi:hypothetical protein
MLATPPLAPSITGKIAVSVFHWINSLTKHVGFVHHPEVEIQQQSTPLPRRVDIGT